MKKSMLFLAAVLSAASLLISCEPEIKEVDKPVYIDSFTASFYVNGKIEPGERGIGVNSGYGKGIGSNKQVFRLVINKLPDLKKKDCCFCIQEDYDGCLCACDFTKDGPFCKCDQNPSCTCEKVEMRYWEKGEGEEPLAAEIMPESATNPSGKVTVKVDKIYLNNTSFYIHVTEPYVDLNESHDGKETPDFSKIPEVTSWYIAQEPLTELGARNSLIYSDAAAFRITKNNDKEERFVLGMLTAQLNVDDQIINWNEIRPVTGRRANSLSIQQYSNETVNGLTYSGYETGLLDDEYTEWTTEQITQVYMEVTDKNPINLFIKASPLDYGKKIMVIAREIKMDNVAYNIANPGLEKRNVYGYTKNVYYSQIPLMGSLTVSFKPESWDLETGVSYMFYTAIYDGKVDPDADIKGEYPAGLDTSYFLTEESNDIMITCVDSKDIKALKDAADSIQKYTTGKITVERNDNPGLGDGWSRVFCEGIYDASGKKVDKPEELFKTIGKDYLVKFRYEDYNHDNIALSRLLSPTDYAGLFTEDGYVISELVWSKEIEVAKIVTTDTNKKYFLPVIASTRRGSRPGRQ